MSASRPPQKPLKALGSALAELLEFARALGEVEAVTTFDADGRVLAEDLVSALHVPPQDNSSMDGYAVRCADVVAAAQATGGVMPVSQRIAAGSSGVPLAPMSVARIFTGAPIPVGADAVVMQAEVSVTAEGTV